MAQSEAVRRHDEREYRVLHLAIFLIALPIVALLHLIPRPWRPAIVRSAENLSVVGEARAFASTTAPYAFVA